MIRFAPDNSIGEAIRARRKARKLTLAAVAKAAEIDVSHLSKVERGICRAGVDRYARIASALGWDVASMWRAANQRRRAA